MPNMVGVGTEAAVVVFMVEAGEVSTVVVVEACAWVAEARPVAAGPFLVLDSVYEINSSAEIR